MAIRPIGSRSTTRPAQPVSLLDWSLTDSATNLTKWRFPDVTVAPNSYLVVFASGKDIRNAGEPLHTNFKLDDAGEYLALVAADGVTVASSFQPAYPLQVPNISFGLQDVAGSSALLAATAPARVLIPGNDALGTNWTAQAFNDSTWLQGANGVGYETSPAEYASLIPTDVRQAMAQNNSCYVRLPFRVDDPAAFSQWRLLVQYNDGFIAYLNGHEVARRNAPDNAAWNSAATGEPSGRRGACAGRVQPYAGRRLDRARNERARTSWPEHRHEQQRFPYSCHGGSTAVDWRRRRIGLFHEPNPWRSQCRRSASAWSTD